MSQEDEISSTTKDHRINYSKFDREFCVECQDTKKVLGHSSMDCPEMVCKNCLKYNLTVKGHHAGICARPALYRPEESIQIQTDLMTRAFSEQQKLAEKHNAKETSQTNV